MFKANCKFPDVSVHCIPLQSLSVDLFACLLIYATIVDLLGTLLAIKRYIIRKMVLTLYTAVNYQEYASCCTIGRIGKTFIVATQITEETRMMDMLAELVTAKRCGINCSIVSIDPFHDNHVTIEIIPSPSHNHLKNPHVVSAANATLLTNNALSLVKITPSQKDQIPPYEFLRR